MKQLQIGIYRVFFAGFKLVYGSKDRQIRVSLNSHHPMHLFLLQYGVFNE